MKPPEGQSVTAVSGKPFHRNGRIYVSMTSGLDFSFPIQGNPVLEGKPEHLLSEIEVSPFGLHWPKLDEDLSIKGILVGDYGQRSTAEFHRRYSRHSK